MAHDVIFRPPIRELGKTDVDFVVNNDAGRLGTLRISKGALVWFPRRTKKGHKVEWEMFDEYMRDRRRAERGAIRLGPRLSLRALRRPVQSSSAGP